MAKQITAAAIDAPMAKRSAQVRRCWEVRGTAAATGDNLPAGRFSQP